MDNTVCAVCGKNAEKLTVHECEKLFHLDCDLLYKRQPTKP